MSKHWLVLFAFLLLVQDGVAHGVRHTIQTRSTVVHATYDDGSPMAFCDAAIFAPDKDVAFQTGSTDRNGTFAFVPDTNGTWRITVDDGMGHMMEAAVAVNDTGTTDTSTSAPTARLGGTVVGISLIFGVFGAWAMLNRRRGSGSPS